MECQAPQRLDENGNVRQEYIDFMKKIPSPEERAKMTEDEILDWFISRRGGDRESIKYRIGEGFFNFWIEISNRSYSFLDTNLPINSKPLLTLNQYFNETGVSRKDWNKEKIIEWFKEREWVGFKNEDDLLNDIYQSFACLYIDSFRNNSETFDWEERIIEWTRYGIDLNDLDNFKKNGLMKELLLNKYCVDGSTSHSCIECFNN